jgi:hypothetical protein
VSPWQAIANHVCEETPHYISSSATTYVYTIIQYNFIVSGAGVCNKFLMGPVLCMCRQCYGIQMLNCSSYSFWLDPGCNLFMEKVKGGSKGRRKEKARKLIDGAKFDL